MPVSSLVSSFRPSLIVRRTNPNPGRPRAVFKKKTSTHEVMLQHSQTEHPVACADMAKLSNDKLAEMKARLPPQGR